MLGRDSIRLDRRGVGRARIAANAMLDRLTTPGGRTHYFDGIPVREMLQIVARAGFSYDPDEGQMILCGRDGRTTVGLTFGGADAECVLVFTWYKMDVKMDVTGRYEIVAYVS